MTSPAVEKASGPSRQFMVTKAVLDGCAAEWFWMEYPEVMLVPFLHGYTHGGTKLGGNLHIAILKAFDNVRKQYQ